MKPHLLYLVYWGAMEPLGQALIIPPLLRFAAAGVRLTLVTFEKARDLQSTDELDLCSRRFREARITWIPQRYHPGISATTIDVAQALVAALSVNSSNPDLIIGRTYVGGLMGLLISKLLRRPFVFHNEGFWPDEMVDGGNWPAGCWKYRFAKWIEKKLYRQAAGVITLTSQAQGRVVALRTRFPPKTTIVVPSCVDLDAFRPAEGAGDQGQSVSLAYIGSLGGRYRIGEMARFFLAARKILPSATLTIYSHSNVDMIRARLREHGVPDETWKLDYVPHQEMGKALQRHVAGLFFLAPGVSSLVCSPTKIGEYWASGLPVVTTPLVGDVEAMIHAQGVGVVIPRDTDEDYLAGASQLMALLQDPQLKNRCRQAAERLYDLSRGVEVQLDLFQRILGSRTGKCSQVKSFCFNSNPTISTIP